MPQKLKLVAEVGTAMSFSLWLFVRVLWFWWWIGEGSVTCVKAKSEPFSRTDYLDRNKIKVNTDLKS
jgi:hypothetical protein